MFKSHFEFNIQIIQIELGRLILEYSCQVIVATLAFLFGGALTSAYVFKGLYPSLAKAKEVLAIAPPNCLYMCHQLIRLSTREPGEKRGLFAQ